MNQLEFIHEISKLKPNSTFLTIHHYRNNDGEIADYNIVFNISYENALKKSLDILNSLILSEDLEIRAQNELIESYSKSLSKLARSPIEELEDHYSSIQNEDGRYIKGIKLHNTTNTVHLYGLVVHKRILVPGYYPINDTRRPLTFAKDKLRSKVPVGKFRQFRIQPSQVEKISVQNLSLFF